MPPVKTDPYWDKNLPSASRREIKRVQAMLNDRPRKILNWHSPAHAFHQLLH